MKNAKTTKRALLMSVVSLLVCVAMLIGTTYAWFTDVATTGVNSITTGKLDVEVSGGENGVLYFRDVKQNKVSLWEPGASFTLDSFTIKNNGDLHLKYKVEIEAFSGNQELLDVITLTVNEQPWDTFWAAQKDVALAPNASITVNAVGTMSKEAGNEYQGKTLSGVKITVHATQQSAEIDMTDDTYDKEATYGTPVSTEAELKTALTAGKNVVLSNDITVDEAIKLEKSVIIDLNGKKLDTAAKASRPLQVAADNVELVLNATGTEVTFGNDTYGVVELLAGTDNAKVTINGGTFTGTTDDGALIRFRSGNDNTVVLNNVTYTDNATLDGPGDKTNPFVAGASGATGTGNKLIVNGGTFTAVNGFGVSEVMVLEMKGATLNAYGTAFEISSEGNVIEDCVINLDPGAYVYSVTGSGIAASYDGEVTVKNTVINVKDTADVYALCVYPSGGSINAIGCTINAPEGHAYYVYDLYAGKTGSITVDGEVVASK